MIPLQSIQSHSCSLLGCVLHCFTEFWCILVKINVSLRNTFINENEIISKDFESSIWNFIGLLHHFSKIWQNFVESIASRIVIYKVRKKWKICERKMIFKNKPQWGLKIICPNILQIKTVGPFYCKFSNI